MRAGRLGVVGALLDFVPQVNQEAQVGAEFFFRCALGGGAHDESARSFAALVGKNAFQTLTFFVRSDFAADADVGDRRHEDQEAAGQGDMAGDACALLCDGFLGDLDEDFLAGFQKVRNDRQIGSLRRAAGRSAASISRARAGPAISTTTPTAVSPVATRLSLAFRGRMPLRSYGLFLVL